MDIVPNVADAAVAFAPWLEPTAAELDAIEQEMPLVLAEVDELDAWITVLDRTPTLLDARRVRRARNRVMAARRNLTNRTTTVSVSGGAA
jgi:hypothetical protein